MRASAGRATSRCEAPAGASTLALRVAAAVVLAILLGGPGLASARPTSPCLGAASRSGTPCYDASLRFQVIPSPDVAEITPAAPCTYEPTDDGIFHTLAPITDDLASLPNHQALRLCVFGDRPPVARSGFALLGDSHAGTWRAALTGIAQILHWEGSSLTLASCTFSAARPILPAYQVVGCVNWRREIVAWFQANPQVGTVFVSEHASARVLSPPGTAYATAVAGYRAAWAELPPTVNHIIVLRDTPYVGRGVGPCVRAAIAAHRRAGIVCAVPRQQALRRDPEVAAARETASRAVVIDMTHFFCDDRLCFPVIGGVLVYQDTNHMTRAYSETLAPFLRHKVGQFLEGWH